MEAPKIAVIGAGIMGVSAALRIQQAFPRAQVTIYAERTSPNTTSDVAAGFWCPSYLSDTPQESVISWAKETYEFLSGLATSEPAAAAAGVLLSPGFQIYSIDNPQIPYWSHIPIGFRAATSQELGMFPSRVKSAFYFVSVVAEGSKFLPYLTALFQTLGGKLVDNYRVESFSEICKLGYKYIVNCTGLGAMKLCNDQTMFPIRGQVHRVAAPWVKFWFDSDDGAYCLLNSQQAVLGGVAQKYNWSTAVSARDKTRILERNYDLWPSLKAAPVLSDLVGLRPGRPTVRLEGEATTLDGTQCVIYHNYGHGGSGLTLFWGCARDIADLLKSDIVTSASTPLAKI